MALDSTANLLFSIDADPSAATGNIAKFRSLMSKDLGAISGEFTAWSSKVFGSMSSVSSVALGGTALLAAGAVAVGTAVAGASDRYIKYVEEISRGMKVTGLGAEQMSILYNAADDTGTSYEALVGSLVKFNRAIVAASTGSEQQQKAFQALGISQKDVIAGQKDSLGLLYKVADGFAANSSGVQKTALAMDLFSRGGAEMVHMLSKGSEGLKQLEQSARDAGQVLRDEDIRAVREYKLALDALADTQQGVDIAVGKSTMAFRIWANAMQAAVLQEVVSGHLLADLAGSLMNPQMGFGTQVAKNYAAITAEIERMTKAAGDAKDPPPLLDPGKAKEAQQNWYGISSIMESLRGKIAGTGDETDRMVEEMRHYGVEIDKAREELTKLQKEGKVTAEAAKRESGLLAELPTLLATLGQRTREKILEAQIIAKEQEELAFEDLHRSLVQKLAGYAGDDFAAQRNRFAAEMSEMQRQMELKATLTDAEYQLLADITRAGLAKINAEQTDAYLDEMGRLNQQLAQTVERTLLSRERLEFAYQRDLQAFSEVEEQKALRLAQSEAEQAAIREMFATGRQQLLQQYREDLQVLTNSEGWQGVFGQHFGQMLQHNEGLLRAWATSSNQSLLMVRVSMETLREMSKQAFGQFAQGMGQNIAQAVIYSTSIGKAARAALVATLESLASQALAHAVFSTALGFYRLAMHDPVGASAAFTAAAIFGTVGAVAAVAGRLAAPKDAGGTGGGAPGSGGGTGSASASGGAGGSDTGTSDRRPHLTVVVQGHVIGSSGRDELLNLINEAVYENDGTLYASHSRDGKSL